MSNVELYNCKLLKTLIECFNLHFLTKFSTCYVCRSSLNPTNDKTIYGTFVNIDPTVEDLSLRVLVSRITICFTSVIIMVIAFITGEYPLCCKFIDWTNWPTVNCLHNKKKIKK